MKGWAKLLSLFLFIFAVRYLVTTIIYMKWLHFAIFILFTLFAYFQWNDPDPLVWIVIYLIVASVAFQAYRGRFYHKVNVGIILIFLVGAATYVPDLLQWFRDDMPSLTESMKASSPYIELVREFFGLIIAIVVMSFYLVLSKKYQS